MRTKIHNNNKLRQCCKVSRSDSPVDVDDLARVRRQVERFCFACEVIARQRSEADWFVEIHVYTDETLEHVRVWRLTHRQYSKVTQT